MQKVKRKTTKAYTFTEDFLELRWKILEKIYGIRPKIFI